MGGIDNGDEVKQLRIGPLVIGYRRRPTPNAFTELGQALDDLGAAIKESGLWRLLGFGVRCLGAVLCFFGHHEWSAEKLLSSDEGYLLSLQECSRCRRRRVGWMTVESEGRKHGPPLPRPRPLPRETIVKGGVGTNDVTPGPVPPIPPDRVVPAKPTANPAKESIIEPGQLYMRIGGGEWLKEHRVAPGISRWDEVVDVAELAMLDAKSTGSGGD